MMKTARVLGILTVALTLSCSSMSTAVDYDHTVDWSQFHTFALAEGTRDPETFTQRRIEDGITQALTSRGWTVATSNPDVLVYSHTVLSQEKQWTATSMGGWGYRGWGGMGMTTATQTKIPIGTIIVDMVNPKTHEMIWRGTAQDQVTGTGADKGKVQAAMQALFRNFPPGSAKS
ncbi:MAG TPA: DUF4136 domain-containing protein [Thermoanaerobaculia bacterium]|nr:DUF4136 domain-containing protein [Thermoanaerobaculia bacterium]